MTIEELAAACREPQTIREIIRVCEARQVKALGRIADAICEKGNVRLALVAGASAAGKTTTAKRLATQLRVNERSATLLSTDDYFLCDKRKPRDASGAPDYEHVESIDIPRLTHDIAALLRGETIHARRYDFGRKVGYDAKEKITLPPGGILVIEGIHALNPRLTEGIPEDVKFRLFVEPKTQLTVFALSALPSTAGRFLRRIVRDCHYRKVTPLKTYRLWPSVLAGEKLWIEPFRPLANATFDSGLDYELAVLKYFVEWPLTELNDFLGGEPNIEKLLAILAGLPAIGPAYVPGDSILRETIGGSQLDY